MTKHNDPWEEAPAPAARFIIVPHFMYESLRGNEKLVYLSLAYHADERGYSWPSHATIAEESGLSVSTVQRTLRSLLDRKGFRKVKRTRKGRGQDSNGYFIPLYRT